MIQVENMSLMFTRLHAGSDGLVDVLEDVVDVLDANREPHIARRHTRSQEFFFVELAVGGATRVDRQAARVTDVRDVVEQLQVIDEGLARRRASPSCWLG